MSKLAGAFLAAAALCGAAFAQTLAEHSLAAATGSVAGVAGKTVSDGVDKIFGKLKGQVVQAGSPNKPAGKQVSSDAAAPAIQTPVGGKAEVPQLPAPRGRGKALTQTSRVPSVHPFPLVTAAPEPSPPTRAQIASIRAGIPRDEVLTKLGAPAARVFIPQEEGRLVEIYQYIAEGRSLGAVRLTDGVVSEVRVDATPN